MTSADMPTGTHASAVTTPSTGASNATTSAGSTTTNATSTSESSAPKTSAPDRPPLTDHETALHLAVKNKHEKIVRKLLHAGVNVNSIDKTGWSPIQKAVSYHLDRKSVV